MCGDVMIYLQKMSDIAESITRKEFAFSLIFYEKRRKSWN